ncbi:hypothetical protein CLAFUW4_10001 [Fulvia fulva]|uniref:Uncharacterized protein n=1 Tax=Passalora fulva TaxID=5499 RepID=A0A9Q8PHG6_PASFU|nr:uncharacterized protein CLAFUR5_12244 [Fulvia fulva]KAK4616217.1 hypothetical protein CLAFUR4_10005 [Fulvia fulva]KAK4616905.1 hypothetical protein CLAFUR0_10002 [Fulvia fulva]UJO22490.1 hypothetical protein CLAFUR5_12244 [Fulvia fulva]WPV18886.1 hypothetical protein CLAFUW4_10001 [Fulvia fulva]WPV34589.1 hypothetical protein CLAFUW7_10002 [Fulvia fulva]
MGLFDDGRSYSAPDGFLGVSRSTHGSHSRGVSPARSVGGRSTKSQGYFVKPSANSHYSSSRPGYARSASGGFFGGGSKNYGYGGGSRGIFGGGGGSSYYKRRPRDGYIQFLVHKLQRMIKDLWYYARRHPVKAFFAVIVPLLSAGGAIHGLLRQFGIRMPFGLDGATRHGGGGYYGSSGYSSRGGGGLMDQFGGMSGVMGIARAFM